MDNDFNKKHLIYLVFTLAVTALSVAFQLFLILNYYETDVSLYSIGTSLPDIFHIFLLVCTLIVLSSFFVIKKEGFGDTLPQIKSLTVFASSISGLMLLASILFGLYTFITGGVSNPISLQDIFNIFALICAAPASAYFIIIAVKTEPYKIRTSFFGLFIVVWSAFRLISEYFDVASPINNPLRILHQLSYIIIMIFFLYEAGYSANIKKPRLYAMGGYLALIFVFTSSLPVIILNFSKLKIINVNTFSYIIEFCLGFFVLVRMLTLNQKSEEEILT
ncbi:MAG: hypothetical protein FWF15_01120 [Oscillospiraceae bacterium]|nr:hypothetical protein [Oscillospiraceae bacterium]